MKNMRLTFADGAPAKVGNITARLYKRRRPTANGKCRPGFERAQIRFCVTVILSAGWPAFDLGIVDAGSRAGHRVAITRNRCRHFPDVAYPDHRRQSPGRGCRPLESVATLRLSLAPWPVAEISVDRSSPVWLPPTASLSPLTHPHPPGPFPLLERQSLRSLMGASP
jgi:hypothetical protein